MSELHPIFEQALAPFTKNIEKRNPYEIRDGIGDDRMMYQVVDTRTGRVAHEFKFHVDAESCKDSMNEWVRQEAELKR
jgi:hypothetical protein